MLTRRTLLANASKAAVALAAGDVLPALASYAETPDRKGLNGSYRDVRGKRSLRAHARKHGLIAGSAVNIKSIIGDPQYAELISEQCDIVVPHAELKWVALRPARDRFDFSQPDALLAFTQKHHIILRGHTLCWHESVPDWIRTDENKKDARQLLVDHIKTVCGHYKGRIHSWDVVNEAILPKDKQPNALRKSFWYEQVGPDYIDLAFRTAREADPRALLTYNDYGVEYDNDEDAERRELILKLVSDMKQRGVPLDAVGIQSHVKAAQPTGFGKGLTDYIESLRKLGLQVYLTELDVNEDDIKTDDVAARDAEIARVYSDFLKVALANPAVKLVLTWDISDRFTWLNNGPTHHRKQPNRPQRSLPFDKDYRPKEAFFAMRDSFDNRRA